VRKIGRFQGLVTPVVSVVVIVTIAVIPPVAATASGEISPAAPVDPYAALIEAPGLAIDAWRFAALANQADSTIGINAATMKIEVVRRAIKCSTAAVTAVVSILTGADCKICAAAPVDPNAVTSQAPCAAVDASSLALLANDFDAPVSVDWAKVAVEVVRRAIEFIGMWTGHRGKHAAGSWIEDWEEQNRER
jgi:hypothetical protein